jgi:hypothetical protein
VIEYTFQGIREEARLRATPHHITLLYDSTQIFGSRGRYSRSPEGRATLGVRGGGQLDDDDNVWKRLDYEAI